MSVVRARLLVALVPIPSLALGWMFALGASPAIAAPQPNRYVTTTGNDASPDCSQTAPCRTIQRAVDMATAGQLVQVAAGTYAQSVMVDHSVQIVGAASRDTVVTGDGTNPTFTIEPPSGSSSTVSVQLRRLAASHNSASAGVAALAADLTLTNVDVSHNGSGGVAAVLTMVTVSDSTILDNDSTDGSPFPGNGLTVLAGTASVGHTAVRGNAGSGVAVYGGQALPAVTSDVRAAAADVSSSELTLRRSEVSGNRTGGVVGLSSAVTVDDSTVAHDVGGGVVSVGGRADITNSTVTGTKPLAMAESQQGGIISLPAESSSATVSRLLPSQVRQKLAASVDRLSAGRQAAVAHAGTRLASRPAATGQAVVTVSGTIVARQDSLPDCFGPVVDGGYNLSSDSANSCAFSAAKHDLSKTDPLLGPLGHRSGGLQSELPLKGSPAIDAIPAGQAGCSTSAVDQRGVARPQPTGGRCDVGAVELAAKPLAITRDSLPHGTVGTGYHQTLTATGGQYPSYSWSLASGNLPDGLALSSGGVIGGTPTKAGTFTFTVSVNDPVLKTYTIVIDEPAAPNGNGSNPIAETGSNVVPLSATGSAAILAGFLLLLVAGRIGRRPGRHRSTA